MSPEAAKEREACVRLYEFVAERLREACPNDEKKLTAADMCTWLAEEIKSGGHDNFPPSRAEIEKAAGRTP